MGYVGQAPASAVVTSADIADDAVNSDQIAAGAIDAAHMSVTVSYTHLTLPTSDLE